MRPLRHLLLSLMFLLALASTASAQPSDADRATARKLAIEAQEALKNKDYQSAADKFLRAEKLFHAPTLLVGLGRAYVELGKYVQAMESYNKVIREKQPPNATDAFKRAVEDAKNEVVGLDKKIAWVTITVEGPEVPTVELDGVDIPVASLGVERAVDPGNHLVTASAEGFLPGEQTFSIDSAGSQAIALTLEPAPPGADGEGSGAAGGTGGDSGGDADAGGTQRLLGWVAIGVGGAGLIVGAITGGLAMGKHGELSDNCTDGKCPATEQDNLDSFNTFGTVSTVGFIAGGVLAATGVVLLLTAPSGDSEQAATPAFKAELGLTQIRATFSF